MTKDIKQIQEENRKFILEAILSGNNLRILKERIGDFSGLPLTLSKVLLALKHKQIGFYDGSLIEVIETNGYYKEDYNHSISDWNLEKETLEEQAPEVQIAINQLLTK